MPDEISQLLRRVDVIERNQSDQAKSITRITEEVGELQKPLTQLEIDREVRKERDKNLNERLDRIETNIEDTREQLTKKIDGIYSLGKWVLAAFGAAFITALVAFIINGGLRVGQ